MANDRETKSGEVKPERPQDTSAAIRARDTGDRVTHGSSDGTMAGGRDGDMRPHGESGSSGTGEHLVAGNPPTGKRIHSDEEIGEDRGNASVPGAGPGSMIGGPPD